jgi:hypothetical protein
LRLLTGKDGQTKRLLSRAEKKLLRKIGNAKGGESVTEICEGAGVDRRIYYRMLEDPEFKALLPEAIDHLLGEQLIPVVHSVIKRAIEGSAKHSELVFKLAGLISSDDAVKILQVFSDRNGDRLMTDSDINKILLSGGAK